MPSLNKRMDRIEETVEKHLIESGEIRQDLKWLKKFVWVIFSSPIVIEAVKHVHLAGK